MATNIVLVDDFESVIQYSNNADFSTPDPSNSTVIDGEKAKGYHAGTYHMTNVTQASWAFNFTGTSISVYGDKGDTFGTYRVNLDGNTTSYSAWDSLTGGCVSCLLFQADGLTAGPTHTLSMTNGNASMLLDWLQFTSDIGASGATVKNTTVEETDSALKYTGTWGHNASPLFSGGGSSFTNAANATVSLTFNGSAVYIWGDTNANHGEYTVTLDSQSPILLKSVTGCGLPYTVQGLCEQTIPGLVFFRSYLGDSQHTIVIENVPGANGTFFDLDRITYSTPSSYFVPSNSSGGGGGGGGTSTISTTSTAAATHTTGAAARIAPLSFSLGAPASSTAITANAAMLSLFLVWLTFFVRLHRS